MESEKKIFSNKKQLEHLVDFMDKHPLLAKGICDKGYADKKLKTLTIELNSNGPPVKTEAKWQRVWIDLKAKLRKKMIHNKKEINQTGGGPNHNQTLTPLEQKIAEFLNLDKAVNPCGREFGLPEKENSDTNNCDTSFVETIEDDLPEPPPKKRNVENDKMKILNDHVGDFKTCVNKLDEILFNMKATLEFTKKTYNLKKDIYKLKKEKLVFLKEKSAREENFQKSFLEAKKAKIELMKNELALKYGYDPDNN